MRPRALKAPRESIEAPGHAPQETHQSEQRRHSGLARTTATGAGADGNHPRTAAVSRLLSNQSVARAHRAGRIRAKLMIGGKDDPEEQRADRIADDVMAAPKRAPCACGGTCPDCAANKGAVPRRSPDLDGAFGDGGRPLDRATRAWFEPRFGADLSRIRIHDHQDAAGQADAIGARAFAAGDEIGFAQGEFAPHSDSGRRLIAHEIAHVLGGDSGVRRELPDGGVPDGGVPDGGTPAAPPGTPGEFDPCAVEVSPLTNAALIAQLSSVAAYLRARRRGQDRFYDYANLQRRLIAERRRRIGMGHAWMAGEQGNVPAQLYRLDTSGGAMMTVSIVPGETYGGAPDGIVGTVMRPEQFDTFLDSNRIPRIDVAEFYRRSHAGGRDGEQLSILAPPAERNSRDAGIPDFFSGGGVGSPPSIYSGLPSFGPSGLGASPFDIFARPNLTRQVYSPNVTMSNARSRSGAETEWRGGLFETAYGYGSYEDLLRYRDLNRVQEDFRVFDFAEPNASTLTSVTHSASDTNSAFNEQYREKFSRMTGGSQPANFAQMLADVNAEYRQSMTAADLNQRNFLAVPDDHVARVQDQAEWLVVNRPERVSPMLDSMLRGQSVTVGGTAYASWNQVQAARASGALSDGDFATLLQSLVSGARGRVVPAGITMVEVAEMQRIRVATQAYGQPAFDAIAPPEVLEVRRLVATGLPEGEAISQVARGSAGRGAAFGFGSSVVMGGIQYAASDFDPRTGRQILYGLGPQTLGGAVQGYGQAQWNARLGGSLLDGAIASGGTQFTVGGVASRVGGAGALGGPVAALTTWGTMGLQEAFGDADYTDIDYAARGGRAFVSGGVAAMVGEAGALGTAAAFSAAGSEVPIAGNIAGFVIGLGTYFVVDAIWGDEIEGGVRTSMGENGCVGR